MDGPSLNWTLNAQWAWQIDAGEMTKPLRSAEILGNTLTFFQSVDAVGKQFEMMPLPGCGKGDPPQFIHTGVGGPHLRARARVLGAGGS